MITINDKYGRKSPNFFLWIKNTHSLFRNSCCYLCFWLFFLSSLHFSFLTFFFVLPEKYWNQAENRTKFIRSDGKRGKIQWKPPLGTKGHQRFILYAQRKPSKKLYIRQVIRYSHFSENHLNRQHNKDIKNLLETAEKGSWQFCVCSPLLSLCFFWLRIHFFCSFTVHAF